MRIKFIFPLLFFFHLCFIHAQSEDKITVRTKIFPRQCNLQIIKPKINFYKNINNQFSFKTTKGEHTIVISKKGWQSKSIIINVNKNTLIEEKLEPEKSLLKFENNTKTGIQPKSAYFDPTGKFIFVPLLYDNGIDVFSTKSMQPIKRISPPKPYSDKKGYVECAFLPSKNIILISQMTTGYVHAFNYKSLKFLYSINTTGNWSKVIKVSEDETTIYVSNWISKDISIINVDKKEVTKKIKVSGIPRGMSFSPDNKYLYICLFDTGKIEKLNLETNTIEYSFGDSPGAKRHIITDKKNYKLYISDMYHNSVFIYSIPKNKSEKEKLLKTIWLNYNINTIVLSKDKKYLFASSRGINNPKGYTLKGPVFGKIYSIDTQSQKIKEWIWGRNQPTGLDISPDNKMLVFTDFLDQNIEFYNISDYFYQNIENPYNGI